MKSKTTKNKIRILWSKSETLKNKIDIEEIKLKKINEEFEDLKTPTNLSFNKVYKYINDWETPNGIYKKIGSNTKVILWKEWKLTFEKFPIYLIPFLKTAILIDREIDYESYGEEEVEEPLFFPDIDEKLIGYFPDIDKTIWGKTNIFFEVEDLEEKSDLKRVTLNIEWYYESEFPTESEASFDDLKLKLIIMLINPALYK